MQTNGLPKKRLYESKMDYTILQPAMFMQMIASAWKSAKNQGQIIMPYSKFSKMTYVDYRDVAEVAALAMTGTELSYGTFELCSAGMFSWVDIAGLMSTALGKTVQAGDIPTSQWAEKVQIPPGELRDGLIAMNKVYDQYGFSGGNDLILKTILGREPRTVENFIQELTGRSEQLY